MVLFINRRTVRTRTIICATSENRIIGEAGNDRFHALSYLTQTSNITDSHTVMPEAGTIKKLYIEVITNNATISPDILTLYKNDIATALTVIIPPLTTGTFSNITTTVDFVAGDKLNYGMNATSTGNILGNISTVLELS